MLLPFPLPFPCRIVSFTVVGEKEVVRVCKCLERKNGEKEVFVSVWRVFSSQVFKTSPQLSVFFFLKKKMSGYFCPNIILLTKKDHFLTLD